MEKESPLSDRIEAYRRVRGETEKLCEPLTTEDHVVQSMPDVSPMKWHLAHTSWFFETFMLRPGLPGYRVLNPLYETLFNSYYNTVGVPFQRPRRGLLSRPTVDEVTAYRRHVDEGMAELIEQNGDGMEHLLDVGINHEQQHQELMVTDIKHVFSVNPLHPVYREEGESRRWTAPALAWHPFEGGVVEIGHEGGAFAFDNETPRHKVYLEPYALASRPVTAGEYIEFIDDGGYRRPDLWLSDGWDAVRGRSWTAPLYWEARDGAWFHFTLAGLRAVRHEEPVCHVSYYEADAYARWAGARLPTEPEWEAAAADSPLDGNFVETGRLHPAPFAGPPTGKAPAQLFGDVWEWTASPYVSYPGYRPPEGALGEYNAKFMSNRFVLRGGSCATPQRHMRVTYRNFFDPHLRWQFMGLRLARDGGSP